MADTLCRNVRRFPTLKPILRIVVAVLLLALPIQVGVGRTSPDLSEEQLDQLEQGDIVVSVNQAEGPARGTVEATILIDAPVDLIWRIMNDCDEIPTFVPGVKECEVLDSGENWEIIRHEVKWIWLFPRLSYVFRAHYQPKLDLSTVETV